MRPAAGDEVGRELAPHERAPDLRGIAAGGRAQAWVNRREVQPHVVQIAPKKELCAAVVGGRDDLRKVDDRRPPNAHQYIVGREVAVNQIGCEHLHHLRAQVAVQLTCQLRRDHRFDQSRGGLPFGVDHQLHQQHPLVEHHRGGNAHARGVQLVERVGLGRLPGLLRGRLAEPAAAIHRALGARVANRAPFLVAGVVLEIARVALFVDLGRHHLAVVAHQPDVGLLAALEAADHFIDDAVLEEEIEVAGHGRGKGRPIGITPAAAKDSGVRLILQPD